MASLYCGSWLGGLSQDEKLFLCLVLAPEVHRQLGKEDGCEVEQAKTSWIKGKVVPSITELNTHLVQESGKLIQQEDLAEAQLLPQALKVSLQISNNMPEFQQCIFQALKRKKKKWLQLYFCILNLYRISLEAHTILEIHREGNSGEHRSNLAELRQCKSITYYLS